MAARRAFGRNRMKRMPMKTAEEYDALTKTKRFLKWGRGERKRIKKKYNKAERQWLKNLLRWGKD
jgi:hypothetical protein